MQCSSRKPWVLAFMWISLTHKTHPLRATVLPDGSGPLSRTATQEQHDMSSETELKGLTRPPNSLDPNSIGHAGASPIHRGPTLQPTGSC